MLKSKFARLRGPAIHETTLDLGGAGTPLQLTEKPDLLTQEYLVDRAQSGLKVRLKLLTPVLLSVALSIVGQLILKRGMSDLGPVSLTSRSIFEIMWSIATNPFVVVGMIIFAASVLFWLIGLSRVPLSYAYPFISLSYVIILAASYFLLGEQFSLLRIAGVSVICLGVILVAFSNPGISK
jgi:drug/metabolite transporter (DMT)-like permease